MTIKVRAVFAILVMALIVSGWVLRYDVSVTGLTDRWSPTSYACSGNACRVCSGNTCRPVTY